MNDLITCRLLGPGTPGGTHNFGLGNQLFQVANIISLAIDYNYKAIFPDMQSDMFGGYTDNIFSNVDISGDKSFVTSTYSEPTFGYNKIECIPNMELHGYFQSEKYFVHNRDAILDYYSIPHHIYDYIYKKYNTLINSTNSVSVHVRRGDYVALKHKHILLSETDYYDKSLALFPEHTFYIFSDDIEWCMGNFNGDNVVFINMEDDIIDLYLMSLCKHNIIANSSFSWWGAWVNGNIDKTVVAPSKWFGDSINLDYKDIIPNEWVKI